MARRNGKKGIMEAVRRALRVPEPTPAPRLALADVFAPAHTLAMDDAAYRARLAASLGLAQDSAADVPGPYLPPGISTFCAQSVASMSGFIGYPRCAELMQDGLMRRGVTVTADEMTRNFPHFIGTAGQESADAADRLNAEMERLGVVARFHEMAVMCGAFGGGLLFLKRRGEDVTNLAGGISLRPEFFRDGGLEALISVEPFSVGPLAYNSTLPLDGDYFRPSSWFVAGSGEVHASRFLHFTTGELPVILRPAYNFFGVPSVQLALDYLLHFTEDRESAGRLLKKFSLTILKTNTDELLYGDDESGISRRIRILAQHRDNDGVFAISQEDEDIVQVNTPLTGVTDIVRQALEMLAVVWGIPVVKFLGVSPSGMNATGESDMRSFYDHVESQRQKMFGRNFELLSRAMQFSLFGELRADVAYSWPSLWALTERERADMAKLEADTDAIYLDRGILGQEEVRAALSGDEEGRYAGIDPEAVPEPGDTLDEGMGGGAPEGALDAPEWRTSENGKHFEIDTQTGEITKGNVGQKEEISLTGEELGPWKDVKELRKKAVTYYKENYQGKPVHRDDLGDIRFSDRGIDETVAFSANPDKLLMVPALREIIKRGEKGDEEPADHPEKNGIIAFVPVTKKVGLKGELREVEVLIGKDERGNLYYDLFLDGRRQKRKKKSPAGYPKPDPGAAGDSAVNPAVELNIRILPSPVKNGEAA